MKSTVKNVWAAILAMLAALCLAVGGVLFVQTESRLSANNNRAEAAGNFESYDEIIVLKDADGETKQSIFESVVGVGSNYGATQYSGKKVCLTLGENWTLSDSVLMLDIPVGYDITLDLNGHKVIRNTAASARILP